MNPERARIGLIDPSPPAWEWTVAGGVVIMLTGALIGPLFAPTQEETPILRLIWLPVYAATAGLLIWRFERMVAAWPGWLALLACVLLAFASKYWSIDPAVTQRRVMALALTGAFSVYLGAAFRGPYLPRLLTWCTLFMAVGSLVMVFGYPAIGVHQTDNAGLWRGLWYEKNQMGLVMVIGAVSAAAWLASNDVAGDARWRIPAATLFLGVLLTLATQSKTSLLCLLAGVGVVGALWAMRRGGPVLTVVLVWLGVVVMAVLAGVWIFDSEMILVALGKDPSLTGRTDIWAALMKMVGERPWTGFGYGAFWTIDSVPADVIQMQTGWLVPSAHNGWIDLLVQVGWPGAALVGVLIASALLFGVFRLNSIGAREGYWGLAYMAPFLLLSLSESVLLTHQGLPWALFMAILTRMTLPERIWSPALLAPRGRAAYQTRPRIAAH